MTASNFKFLRRVRIHGGESDAVARALHHEAQKDALITNECDFLGQAERETDSCSTFTERKEMSIKTSIRRIALVAVSALGIGLMSVVPANAADGDFVIVTAQPVPAAVNGDPATATQIAGATNFVAFTTAVSNATPLTMVVTGGTASSASSQVTGSGTANLLITPTAGGTIAFSVPTPTAGTITVKTYGFTNGAQNATAESTLTITVVAALSGTVYSKTVITPASEAAAGTIYTYTDALGSVTRLAAASAANTTELYSFEVDQQDSAGATLLAANTKSVVASISGVGSLSIDGAQAVAQYLTLTAASANKPKVYVYSDGRAGKATLTISVNGVAVKSYDFTFWGTVAKYDFAVDNAYLAPAGAGTATVSAMDANGQVVPGATVNFTSATTTVATVTTPSTTAGCLIVACTAAEWPLLGTASPALAGVAKGTSVITAANATSSATVTATATATVTSAVISSVSWAFDKTSYEPGEKATITVTVKDADGNPVGDGNYTLWGTVPTANVQVTAISGIVNPLASVSGTKSYTYYMPNTAGTVTFSGKLATNTSLASTLHGVSVSLSATVTGGAAAAAAEAATDAALEAIDAANAATDAANLAAEAADAATVAAEEARDAADAATAAVEALASEVATLIASLKAQITTLANTVAKIAKKVRA